MARLLPSAIIVLIIAVIFYALVAFLADGKNVWQAMLAINWQLWTVILLLSLANYLLRFFRWAFYIAHLSGKHLPKFKHLLIYFAGFSLTTTPGKAGEAMRSLYLQQFGVSHQHSLSALFVERIMDLIAIMIFASMSFVVLLKGEISAYIAALIAVGIIASAVVLIHLPKDKLLKTKVFLRLPNKLQQLTLFICQTLDAGKSLLGFKVLLWALLLGVLAWGLETYGLYLVMADYQIQQSSILLAMAIYGAAILLGSLSMSPAGLGASELIMASLLALAGFSMPEAIAITYICRLATLWFAVVLGLLSLLVLAALGLKPQFSIDGRLDAK